MKFVTNNPKDPFQAQLKRGQTLQEYLQWRSQFIEGDPKPSSEFSVEQLKRMGLVGLYRRD